MVSDPSQRLTTGARLTLRFRIQRTALYAPPTVQTAEELAPRLGRTAGGFGHGPAWSSAALPTPRWRRWRAGRS